MYSVSFGAEALLCSCEAAASDARCDGKAGAGSRKFPMHLRSIGSTFLWSNQVRGARHVY